MIKPKYVELIKDMWKDVTIEPAIFLYIMSGGLAFGAGQQTQLLLWKSCNVVKGYNSSVCDNLSAEENDHIENEIQIFTNNFTIKDSMLSSWPAIIYVFFAGSLSDKFGRKWLICLPVIGVLMSTIFQIIHYMFIWELPMEFFYLDNWHAYMGSYPMYYMGIYAYGADVSTPQTRAQRLARFDGVEMGGVLLGTFLSPYLFNATGYYGIYIVRLVMVAASLIYWLAYIKSPEELGVVKAVENKKEKEANAEKDQPSNGVKGFIVQYVLKPLKEFYVTLARKRENNLRMFLYINFAVYYIYITSIAYNGDKYLYMVKVFDDFTPEKYAHIGVFEKTISITTLLVIVPFFLNKLRWHETSLQLVVCSIEVVSLTCAAFSANMIPQFALSMGVTSIDSCQWALVRSVFTKMVDKDEVGKVFSFVAILAATLTLFAFPAFKKLYNATLTTFPSAFLLAAAAMYLLALALNTVLFTVRSRFSPGKEDEEEEEEEKEKENKKDENGNLDTAEKKAE